MHNYILNNKFVFLLLLVVLATNSYFLYQFGKTDIHLFINQHHSPQADFFFKYTTHLGDGLMATFVCVLFLCIRYRDAITICIATLFSGMVVQVLKNTIYADVKRPVAYFEQLDIPLRTVEGVQNYTSHSFPSGHTTSAFALAFALILTCNNNALKFIFFTLALVAGYSRMYLSQHFLVDVNAGILLGVVFALLSKYVTDQWKNTWLDSKISICK